MNQNKSDEQLGKFLSLILRHRPETIGIKLDEHGYANVDELLKGINKSGRQIDLNTLERIVRENNKNRYHFNEEHTKIRSNQGHSIPVDLEFQKVIPPNIIYHGTASRFLGSILKEGIKKQGRQYVHLSEDYETAEKVGERHGVPVVLVIDAKRMAQDGVEFYLSENGVWMCDKVEKKYIIEQKKVK